MRRATTRVAAWLAVTAAAVALSWYAVRSVLRDTVFEPPRAPALAADTVRGPAPEPAADNSTISATSLPAPPPTTKPPPPAPPPPPPRSTAPSTPAPTPSPPDQTRSFEVKGGRASFTFRPDSASLIAATPNSGWAVKVWPGDRWLRVDFTRGGRTSSVFVTWNDHPPLAETYEA